MTTEELFYRPEIEQDAGRGIPLNLLWFLLPALAWLLFELTANSSLVAVVACLKFGGYDFRNGFWLWRTDPNQARGQTCLWFYLALGCWKISLTAVALTFGILILTSSLQLGVPGPEILGALHALWISCGLATFSTYIACGLAWKRDLKIWVDSSITWSRKNNIWPPEPYRTNKLHPLLLAAGVVAVTASLVFGIIIGVALAENGILQGGWVVIFVMLMLIFFAGGLLMVTEFLAKKICPGHPSGCWNPEESLSESNSGFPSDTMPDRDSMPLQDFA
ncbi:MAG: hypothetical protein KDA84_04090 [Planctomycetaceae bacterium]|nr:hypothetical protein [Planctomycetaceae bacterium]